MRRIVLGITGVVLVAGLALVATRFTTPAPVYTVAQVQAGLARDPGAWTGRTVLVRGEVDGGWFGFRLLNTRIGTKLTGGPMTVVVRHIMSSLLKARRAVTATIAPAIVPIVSPALSLSDTAAPVSTKRLPLILGAPNPMLAWLRRLPLVGAAMPRPQLLHWGESGVYRVTIQAAPSQSCGARVCYQAEALDATVGPAAQRWGPVFMVPLSGSATVRISSRLTTVRPAPLGATIAPTPAVPAAP